LLVICLLERMNVVLNRYYTLFFVSLFLIERFEFLFLLDLNCKVLGCWDGCKCEISFVSSKIYEKVCFFIFSTGILEFICGV
jgi:hypothetical protein